MNAAATGGKPGVKAIHAGLECGLLIEKMGGDVDALSFGPTITGAHSPDEKVLVDTVLPFFELVQDLLSELAKKRE
jgi:dipeptidase D